MLQKSLASAQGLGGISITRKVCEENPQSNIERYEAIENLKAHLLVPFDPKNILSTLWNYPSKIRLLLEDFLHQN